MMSRSYQLRDGPDGEGSRARLQEMDRVGTVPALTIRDASKQFGSHVAFSEITFTVNEGSFVSLLGASGSGKTSLLRCVAGLDQLSGGEILGFEVPVTGPSPQRIYVFQDYSRSLFPWSKVINNVMFPLEIAGCKRSLARERALTQLELVGLEERADAFPWQLSGGMQQRVAIARALAADPAVLLMDEPFGAVDAQTRMGLQVSLLEIWSRLNKTVLFVTHDIDEALFLGDRVVMLSQSGRGLAFESSINLPRPRSHRETPDQAEYRRLRSLLLETLA